MAGAYVPPRPRHPNCSCRGDAGFADRSGSARRPPDDDEPQRGASGPEPENLDIVEPPDQTGVERLELGPIDVQPGQNNIAYSGFDIPKPDVDGYVVSIKPDLVREDGTLPPVDVIHLHHGIWANLSATPEERDWDGSLGELFLAAGEEKTAMILPPGYGYEYQAGDRWVINYMAHNLTPTPDRVWITYEIGFIPKTAPEASDIIVAKPLWMDVQKGSIYPVFDVLKDSGTDGEYTDPDDADEPYGLGITRNEWRAPRDVVLIAASGHLHPGGKSVDLWLGRADETGDSEKAHVFQSDAVCYEPAGAVSWDVATTGAAGSTRSPTRSIPRTRCSPTATFPRTTTTAASTPTSTSTQPQLADGADADQVTVAVFTYAPGDIYDDVPTVKAGDTLTFTNEDAPTPPHGIWHTITSCEPPCDRSTGDAYPLADGEVQFDSGELGDAGAPTAGRVEWQMPADLPPGTYTYFCRVHPSMRGAFRVVE